MPQLSWYKREEDLTRAALTPYRLLQPVANRPALRLCHCLLAATMVWSVCFSPTALAADAECAVAVPDNLLAQEGLANGIVAFQLVEQANDEDGKIQLVY